MGQSIKISTYLCQPHIYDQIVKVRVTTAANGFVGISYGIAVFGLIFFLLYSATSRFLRVLSCHSLFSRSVKSENGGNQRFFGPLRPRGDRE